MCWTSTREIKAKIAVDNNISIYKLVILLTDNLYSAYKGFPYELNEEYSLYAPCFNILTKMFDFYQKNVGFHSYHPEMTKTTEDSLFVNIYDENNELLDRLYRKNIVRVNGYIPKGASYFLNDRGEYVSDKIYLTDIDYVLEK